VVVYVEPAFSALIMTTGMRPAEPADTDVIVEGDPETVVVLHSVTGYTRVIADPALVVVIVAVVTDPISTVVVVACAPPIVPSKVTVVVNCGARFEAWFSAFCKADAGIGAPAISQTSWRGFKSMLMSRSLSHCPCIQVIRPGRKFPADARQRHATSRIPQLSSWD